MTALKKLRKELFGSRTLLTEDEVRQLMREHARLENKSGRQLAVEAGLNTTYRASAMKGKQHVGEKIAKQYGLRVVRMYEVVED